MQFAFSSTDGSSFEAKIAFDAYDYANIDFLDHGRRDVPLHLSFRLRRQVMVYNQFLGENWGPERPTPIDVAPDREMTVRVEFYLDQATVLLEGVKVGVFALPEPTDGTDCAVHWVSLNGGVGAFEMQGEAHAQRKGRGLLYSDRPFLLEGWGFDPTSRRQDLAVALAGTDHALPVVIIDEPDRAREQRAPTDRIGVVALVPGWIWTYLDAEDDAAEFQLTANGRPCGHPLRVTRQEIADTVQSVCGGPGGRTSLDMLTALEHAKFAGILDHLSPQARANLRDAAERYGVTSFFAPPEEPEQTFSIALPGAPTRQDARPGDDRKGMPGTEHLKPFDADDDEDIPVPSFNQVWNDVLNQMATTPPEDMVEVLRDADLDQLTRNDRSYLLRLCARAFCYADRFEDLFGLAQELGLSDMPRATDDWGLLCGLPFQFINGNEEAVSAIIKRLPALTGFIESQSLSWTLKRALARHPGALSEEAREEMLEAFFDYALKQEPDYHSALNSTELIEVAVAAVQALPTLSDHMQSRTVWCVLRLYAYSRQFWTSVAEKQQAGDLPDLNGALLIAQERYWAFDHAIEQDDPSAGYRQLIGESADAKRLRCELATSAQRNGLSTEAVLALGHQTDPNELVLSEALVRHQAFPARDADLPGRAEETRRAIRYLTRDLPRSPYAKRPHAAGRAAHALLERPVGDRVERAELLSRFVSECALLASWRSEYLGFALPISLLAGALTNRDTTLAAEIPARIEALMASLPANELAEMCAATAIRNALWSLREAPGAEQSAPAEAVFDAFAPAMPHLAPPLGPTADALTPKTGIAAFHGLLIVVYSCRANLETRVQAIRDTWLKDAEALGIPHIVIVGDGAGQRDGDVVYLDAPDDYVSLPRKTLAMVEWVVENTGFSNLYKIDDDCFVSVDQAIGSLNYAKYSYYGRQLRRLTGGTDRLWHHTRGAKGTQTQEIDKSPEPSSYADGGCGYFLDRHAMQSLVNASTSRHGAWLRLGSFMEDKLVGDMLALDGIGVSNADYHTIVLRKNSKTGTSVCRLVNNFMPSASSPSVMAYLGNASLLQDAARTRLETTLQPKRLWPSSRVLDLGYQNLQVACVGPQDKLETVNAADLCVVACMRNERKMLPMFLEHYRKLGVTGFLIADNLSDDGTLEYLLEQPDVAAFSVSTEYNLSRYGVTWQHTLISQLRMNRWSLVADADEFLVLPDGVSALPDLLHQSEFSTAECARIFMLDLYPQGDLEDATLASGDPFSELTHCERHPFIQTLEPGPFDNAETWTSGLRHRLLKGSRPGLFVAQKYALIRYKPWMRFTEGLHYAAEARVAPRDLVFAHFKYHSDFYARAQIETQRGQHFNDAEEYRKYLALKEEGQARIYDPELSVRWRDCDWVRQALRETGPTRRSEAAE